MEYKDYQVNEKDWKLFRKLLPDWQESYMEKLVEEYKAILILDTSINFRHLFIKRGKGSLFNK